MDDRVYWIWLQHAFGAGSPMPWRLHQRIPGGVEGFYRGGPRLWNSLPEINDQAAAALYSFSLAEAQAQLEYAIKVGWRVITPDSPKYPAALRNIYDPPAVLYGKGTLPDVDQVPAVAVVGARKAKPESENKAKEIGYQLAIGGAAVITGGALGIDTAAAMGVMSGRGQMISVLPVALNSSYLGKNAFFREKILERGGALLTEYFSQQSPGYGTFQKRNRLVTGLSCGVVLIQAARKSGTSMYAALAKDQDRDVFVWPGIPEDPAFAGGRDLLADGAKAVERGEDILEEYLGRFQDLRKIVPFTVPWESEEPPQQPLAALADSGEEEAPEKEAPEKKEEPYEGNSTSNGANLSPEQASVLEVLEEEPLPAAVLQERTGLPMGKVLGSLTVLELKGLAKSCPGKRYRRL